MIRIFSGKGHTWFNQFEELYPVLIEIKKFIGLRKSEVLKHGVKAT